MHPLEPAKPLHDAQMCGSFYFYTMSNRIPFQNTIRPMLPNRMTGSWITLPTDALRIYFNLCIIKYFLNIISPNNDMKAKVDALLSAYPSIDVTAMGFPRGWESEPLWQ